MWDLNEQVLREQHNELLRHVAHIQLQREARRARQLTQPQPGLIAALARRFSSVTEGRKAAPLRSRWRTRKL